MAIGVVCKRCGKRLAAPSDLAGKQVKCPGCAAILTVPAERPGNSPSSSAASRSSASRTQRASAAAPKSQPADPLDLGALSEFESRTAARSQPYRSPAQSGGKTLAYGAGGYGQKRKRGASSEFPWVWVLGIGGGGLALLMLIGLTVVGISVYHAASQGQVALGETNVGAASSLPSLPPPPAGTGGGASVAAPRTPSSLPSTPSGAGSAAPVGREGVGSLSESRRALPDAAAPPPPARDSRTPTDSGVGSSGVGSQDQNTASTDAEDAESSSGRASLVDAMSAWQAVGASSGQRAVEGHDLVIYHYSWMTELLPELGHQKLFDAFDFDHVFIEGRNAILCRQVVPEFLNPLDGRQRSRGRYFDGMGLTHFVGMSGVDPTRNSVAAALPRTDPLAGVFGYDAIARPIEITDGTSNTILLIGSGLLAGPWVSGGGHTIRAARDPFFDPITGFGSVGLDRTGAMVMMADGSVRQLDDTIDPEILKALCTIGGGETVDASKIGTAAADWATLPPVPAEPWEPSGAQ